MIKLSFSAAQKYILSPFSYYAHYFLRLRESTSSSALIFGSALDSGLNSLLRDKGNNDPIDIDKAKQEFTREMLQSLANGPIKYSKADLDESLLTSEDMQSDVHPSWLCLVRKGEILIEEYAEQVIPRIEEVILVQHNISLKNDYGDEFIGVIDFVAKIEGKIWVIDNKSSSVSYTDSSASESPQLASYYESLRDKYELAGVMFCVIPKKVRKKKLPRVEIKLIPGVIDESLIEKTFEDYDKVLQGIKTAYFPCIPEKCCATPWGCSFERYCRSGGEDTTGLEYVKESKK